MKLGPVMVGVEGLALTAEDAERLAHPRVGGVILFARNYDSPAQLVALVRAIRAVRRPELLVAVDHEGGRVQRFRAGFTAVPPMRELGRLLDRDRAAGLAAARACGHLIAAELQAHGVDITFAPVLDLDWGESGVIGDRAFHRQAAAVADLAEAFQAGLVAAGMTAVGKHFPGHGFVRADSHTEIPVDGRTLAEIRAADLEPFARLAKAGMGAVMPAHVIYPKVDARPAGFSPVWIGRILRGELGFDGIVFSDDLGMEGASAAGGMVARAHAALDAGADVVLVCNGARAQDTVLEGLERRPLDPALERRLARMRRRAVSTASLAASAAYLGAAALVADLARDRA